MKVKILNFYKEEQNANWGEELPVFNINKDISPEPQIITWGEDKITLENILSNICSGLDDAHDILKYYANVENDVVPQVKEAMDSIYNIANLIKELDNN